MPTLLVHDIPADFQDRLRVAAAVAKSTIKAYVLAAVEERMTREGRGARNHGRRRRRRAA